MWTGTFGAATAVDEVDADVADVELPGAEDGPPAGEDPPVVVEVPDEQAVNRRPSALAAAASSAALLDFDTRYTVSEMADISPSG